MFTFTDYRCSSSCLSDGYNIPTAFARAYDVLLFHFRFKNDTPKNKNAL